MSYLIYKKIYALSKKKNISIKETIKRIKKTKAKRQVKSPQEINSIIIGGRSYEILGFLQAGEYYIGGDVMITRALEENAYLGEEDARHLLKHQRDIPRELRQKAVFVFPAWRHFEDYRFVYYIYWRRYRWVQEWDFLGDACWGGVVCFLRPSTQLVV